MATTVEENTMGAVDFSSLSHGSDQNSDESTQYSMGDKAYDDNFSAYRPSTNIPKSESPNCSFDLSSFSTQSREYTNKYGEQTNSFLEEHSLSLKSNYSSYDFEKILNDSTVQQTLKQELSSQSSIDALLGGNFDTYKAKILTSDKPSENKWDFKTDYNSYACEKNTTNSAYDKNAQKYDMFASSEKFRSSDKFLSSEKFSNPESFSMADSNCDDYRTKSQSFDFEHLMQTYSLENSKETPNKPEMELDVSNKLHTKSTFDFQASDVAMRLRNSVQSDFLSSELWKGTPTKIEDTKIQGSNAIRTIEEILKHHGISDNAPVKSSFTADDGSKKAANSSTVGQKDLSQNNECTSGLTKSTGSEPGQTPSFMQDKDPYNAYATSSNKDMNSSFRADTAAGSSLLDSKSFATQGTNSFSVNISQNNETTSKSQNPGESDPLKRYGSSVDYKSTGKYSMNSGSSNFRKYDFGKSSPLSGDNAGSAMHFSGKESKQFGGNSEMGKFDSPQSEGKSTFNPSKASHIDIIKNMGSATDALEYSMSSERQRLRKLDTMISATPFNYSSVELPRSLRAQFMSPERTYSSLMSNDLPSRRIYSTSNMTSTSTHGARYPSRNPMSGNVGQRDSSTALNKSISAPGSTAMSSVASHGSPVDGRGGYWPYNSKRSYNMQYNNAYNPQLLEKFVRQKTDIGSQKKVPASKKKECSLKSAKDECSKRNDMLYHQTATGIQFLNNSQTKRPATAEKKKVAGKLDAKKKTTDKDFNHSKNIGGLYDGFDFVKDLNRMWQETVFGPQKKPVPTQRGKYTPYKPAAQKEKESKQTAGQDGRDSFAKDLWQPSIQRSDSNWTLNSSTGGPGKLQTYGRDYGLHQPVQKVRSQCSLTGPSSSQTKNKGNNLQLKTKPNASSTVMTKQPATPKSILKQPTNNKTNGMPSNANRSQSSLATSSKSCTPYQMIRGFSPVDPHRSSRSSTATLGKKQNPFNNKRLASRTGTIPKQGRRI